MCVRVCTGQTITLFWRKTQRKGWSSRSPARPEVDEERNVPEKTQGQLTKEDGEMQSTSGRRDQSAWDSSPGEGCSAEGGSEGRQSKMSWHSYWLLLKFRDKYTPAIVYRCTCLQSVKKPPFLRLELTQVRVCSFVLFLPPTRLILCCRCEMWNTPGWKWKRKTTGWITGHE